jgi:hypothetical protein
MASFSNNTTSGASRQAPVDKKFARQFGRGAARTLLRCPTAVADLAQLRAAGIRIRRYPGPKNSAYAMAERRAIYISSHSTIGAVIGNLAHEKVHVLDSPTRKPLLGITTREEFIEHGLAGEVDAVLHEAVVVGELLRAGYRYVSRHKLKLWRRARKGRAAVRRWLETARTSTDGETYPDYYGNNWYDVEMECQLRSLRRSTQVCARASRAGTGPNPDSFTSTSGEGETP